MRQKYFRRGPTSLGRRKACRRFWALSAPANTESRVSFVVAVSKMLSRSQSGHGLDGRAGAKSRYAAHRLYQLCDFACSGYPVANSQRD